MRLRRIKLTGSVAHYHLLSRTTGGQFLFEDSDKEMFRRIMRRRARFCGIRIVDHIVMTNHFHIHARVEKKEVTDEMILRRVKALYGAKSVELEALREAHQSHGGHLPEDLRQKYRRRMGDISEFMKEVKQCFSRWYNQVHGRVGTLWSERFKSLVVDPTSFAMAVLAVYIGLNAVRAGIVSDPKDYRFCGYAEALAGNAEAREGICLCMGEADWEKAAALYRQRLFAAAAESKDPNKAVMDLQTVRRELKREGKLSQAERLLFRIRYLTDGVVLGRREFVESVYREFRDRFGKNRKSGARRMRGCDWGGMCVLRDLRLRLFGE
jgi:REP element-mobilizing transposase RayT